MLNLYWSSAALIHLLVAITVRNKFMREHVFKIPEYLPGTILWMKNYSQINKPSIKAVI